MERLKSFSRSFPHRECTCRRTAIYEYFSRLLLSVEISIVCLQRGELGTRQWNSVKFYRRVAEGD